MDQYEAAADITFTIDVSDHHDLDEESVEVTIASIDTSKDIEIEQIRGNHLKAVGYSVTEIEFSGSVTFDGNGFVEVDGEDYHLEELFTNDDGVPTDGSEIQIFHEKEDKNTSFKDVMVTSDGYETDAGDVSGVTFDWIARDRDRYDVDGDE